MVAIVFHVTRFCDWCGIPSTTALLQNCFSTCAVAVGTTPRSVSFSTAWNTSSFSSIPAKDEMHARSSAPASQSAWWTRHVTFRHATITVVYRSRAFVTRQQACLQQPEDAFVHGLHFGISWFPSVVRRGFLFPSSRPFVFRIYYFLSFFLFFFPSARTSLFVHGTFSTATRIRESSFRDVSTWFVRRRNGLDAVDTHPTPPLT